MVLEETVRSIVPVGARFLVAAVTFGLLNFPAWAASEKPLGVILTAENARLDNAKATIGADVFSGDALVTEDRGSVRVTVGSSQVYLLADSSGMLMPNQDRVQARVDIGTMGFSSTAPAQLEVRTPLAVIRGADGNPIFGQVTVLSAYRVRISAFKGTLRVADNNGGERTIAAGETYEASEPDPNPHPSDNPPPKGVTGAGVNWSHVLDVAIPAAAAGVLSCALWSESGSNMGCWN